LTTPTLVWPGLDIQGKCIINSWRRHILLRALKEEHIYGERALLLQEERRVVLLPPKEQLSQLPGVWGLGQWAGL